MMVEGQDLNWWSLESEAIDLPTTPVRQLFCSIKDWSGILNVDLNINILAITTTHSTAANISMECQFFNLYLKTIKFYFKTNFWYCKRRLLKRKKSLSMCITNLDHIVLNQLVSFLTCLRLVVTTRAFDVCSCNRKLQWGKLENVLLCGNASICHSHTCQIQPLWMSLKGPVVVPLTWKSSPHINTFGQLQYLTPLVNFKYCYLLFLHNHHHHHKTWMQNTNVN